MPGTVALVVAAGRGSRFGATHPKQYAPLAGRPVLRHALETFRRHPGIDAIQAVIHPDDRAMYAAAAEGLGLPDAVAGGATRQESVQNGLLSLAPHAPTRVLIHDGARPLIGPAVIDRVLDALGQAPGAIAALPVIDTLKRGGADGRITATLERTGLWRAQTPQGFNYTAILAAHDAARGQNLTDDAAVAEQAGLTVRLVEGAPENFKVTTQEDLVRAEHWLRGETLGETRVGQGFDVHRFGPGSQVMLCGIAVPHDAGLLGHSDADVGLHALTDAILGALGAGDIGSHFPPSDPQWRGADSGQFVRHAADLVRSQGGALVHADVTLICERPKVGAYREAMVARVAALLDIGLKRVSVKATTTEELGFTGRREGIAAQAVATIRLPSAG